MSLWQRYVGSYSFAKTIYLSSVIPFSYTKQQPGFASMLPQLVAICDKKILKIGYEVSDEDKSTYTPVKDLLESMDYLGELDYSCAFFSFN